MSTSKPPIERIGLGPVRAAIWLNTDQSGNERYSLTFERIYRDAEGSWKSSSSFDRDEALLLAKVADLANTRVFELQAERREAKHARGDSTAQRDRGRSR
ncbi:MAG: hypothetical protein AAGJ54_11025 [Planctomycetota bacterium]